MNGPQWVGVLVLAALVAVVLYPLVIGDRLRLRRWQRQCPHQTAIGTDGLRVTGLSLLFIIPGQPAVMRCIRCGAEFPHVEFPKIDQ